MLDFQHGRPEEAQLASLRATNDKLQSLESTKRNI